MDKTAIVVLINQQPESLQQIGNKIVSSQRISYEDYIHLFEKARLSYVDALANFVRIMLHGENTFFNRNFHIEPTNVCVFSCHFCSYSRLYVKRDEGWELTIDQMLDIVKKYDGKPDTEVHIVGGEHPKMYLPYFAELL